MNEMKPRAPFEWILGFVRSLFLRRIKEAHLIGDLNLANEAVLQAKTILKVKTQVPEFTVLLENKFAHALYTMTGLDPNDPQLERKLVMLYSEMHMILNGLLEQIYQAEDLVASAEQNLKLVEEEARQNAPPA